MVISEQDALIAAIKANPDDDTPRLVYADWLQERCDPWSLKRAGFIREWVTNRKGEKTTEAPFNWAKPGWGHYTSKEFIWSRGFVSEIAIGWYDFTKNHQKPEKRKACIYPMPWVKISEIEGWGNVRRRGLRTKCLLDHYFKRCDGGRIEWKL